jgi:hypothetical protein
MSVQKIYKQFLKGNILIPGSVWDAGHGNVRKSWPLVHKQTILTE